MDRRDFLGGAARAGVALGGALSPLGRLLGQTAINHAGRIDVHHHYLPPFREGPSWSWSPATALADMDRHDVATAILSGVTFPEPLNDGTPAARDLARRANEYVAGLAVQHPGRFGLFAAIPLADNDGSLAEIEYAFDTLQADGVTIQSSAARTWPGDPAQMPVFEELNRRRTTVFLHPNTTPFCCINPPGVPHNVSEFDNDVNRAVLSLLWNGVLTHYPDISFIVAHTGGTVPVLAGRIQDRVPEDRPDLFPHGALDKLRRLYLELGHASFPWVVRAALEFSGPSRLLFGTDYPVEPHEVTTRHIPALGLAPEVLYAIDRGNAERLFPRHRA
ncbi:MAG: amidohydrolase family protein [Rhodospirillaceae bacterium]|nr:amidohydrolase family protein [Rhodospirillaceae bacterium]